MMKHEFVSMDIFSSDNSEDADIKIFGKCHQLSANNIRENFNATGNKLP